MYSLLRGLMFRLDPERAHDLTLSLLEKSGPLARLGAPAVPALPTRVMGMDFPNPVGLAAGLDKNGDYLRGLARLGFGFIELGTVTPRSQPGNPRPRLFRLPRAEAIINRMGFNNHGVDHLVEQVRRADYRGVLGINIGKNFDTPVERAAEDYLICLRKVYAHAGYVVVNVSSPNTPGLRNLQHGTLLDELLGALKAEQDTLRTQHERHVPLLVKIAPDLAAEEIELLATKLLAYRVDGVIATNTTLSREGVQGESGADEQGGLSGKPLMQASTQVLRQLHARLGEQVPIIGVGGICSGADAVTKQRAGAQLVQLYSGLIYRGPQLVSECVRALVAERG